MSKILTIIVSYNFIPWMEKCLNSVISSEYKTDILVIDNNSSDKTTDIIRQKYPSVQLIENKQNYGFGKANNIGIKKAIDENYDYVFLLNQDAWVEKNTIGVLVELAEKNRDYAILSPVHMNGSVREKIIWRGFSNYTGLKNLDDYASLRSVPFISAAIWLLPVPSIRRIGMFSPLFYHYGEDKDYANRVIYYKYKIGYTTKALAYHDCDKETSYKKRMWIIRTYHLSEYANINYSFIKGVAYGPLAVIKKALISLFKFNIIDFKEYIRMLSFLVYKTHKVIKTRKISKNVNLENYYVE